jgi:uncharacterized protein Ymh
VALCETRNSRRRTGCNDCFVLGWHGVFKNPSSHRQVTYDDATMASEIVLLADLLLRMLDRRNS